MKMIVIRCAIFLFSIKPNDLKFTTENRLITEWPRNCYAKFIAGKDLREIEFPQIRKSSPSASRRYSYLALGAGQSSSKFSPPRLPFAFKVNLTTVEGTK